MTELIEIHHDPVHAAHPRRQRCRRGIFRQPVPEQHRLQVAGYRDSYPQALYQVLERDGVAVGRLVTAAVDGTVRVVEIAVLPSARRTGVAADALRSLQAQAAGAGHVVALSVGQNNVAARRLYETLGFAVDSEDTMRLELRWHGQIGVQPPDNSRAGT
jgi:ribosomal protein S18 acetylase RimI-like enzyme